MLAIYTPFCFQGLTTEICVAKTAEIRCPTEHVIQITSARYGRMEIGTCVTLEFDLRCFKDILQAVDSWCSGKDSCVITNDKRQMDAELGIPCTVEELASYIEITHVCVPGKATDSNLRH